MLAKGNPYSDNLAAGALTLLVRGLSRVHAHHGDLEARTACQLGMFQAAQATQSGPMMGASHAIGHILGPLFDVPHGETSCVVLPSVLRWNAEVGSGQQQRQHRVTRAFQEAYARCPAASGAATSAADCVAALVRELGLPGSLAEVGVKRSALEDCAKRTMHDPLTAFNPRKIEGWQDVLQILLLSGPFAPQGSDLRPASAKL